jgi:hypothetical protein
MLKIKNRHKLISEKVLRHTTDGYSIEGVYEYPDHYQIHIRSENKTIPDESLLLLRNRVIPTTNLTTNYYTLYNSNEPQRRLNITIPQIRWKEMFIHNIETILKMNN